MRCAPRHVVIIRDRLLRPQCVIDRCDAARINEADRQRRRIGPTCRCRSWDCLSHSVLLVFSGGVSFAAYAITFLASCTSERTPRCRAAVCASDAFAGSTPLFVMFCVLWTVAVPAPAVFMSGGSVG